MTRHVCDWCGKAADPPARVDFAPIFVGGAVYHYDICHDCECQLRRFIAAFPSPHAQAHAFAVASDCG